MDRKVFDPNAELLSKSENAEDAGGKEARDGHCHPGKPLREKFDQILAEHPVE